MMNSNVKAMTAAALEKGDPSELCTKNIDGHMFLRLASELESTNLDDDDDDDDDSSSSDSTSSFLNSDAETSDFETDSFYSDNDTDSLDSSEEITVSLLDENGKEFQKVSYKDNLYRPSSKSVPDILKNLPATPELISEQLSYFSSQVLPNTSSKSTDESHLKSLPAVSSNSTIPTSTYNTYIIKTTLPLTALELKSIICSSGSLPANTLSKGTTITSNKFSKPLIIRSSQNKQSISSSISNVSLLSPKPVTTTTNIITSPISSVNKISFLDKSLIPASSSSFNTNSFIIKPTCKTDQLTKALPVSISSTPNNQLSQSFPQAPSKVIKPINPVIDTGQLVPKVQINNTDFSNTLKTSQALTSNVQSKSPPTSQLVNVSMSNNPNSLQMTPCLIISDSGSVTSSTQSLIKKPIVHTGFVPQSLLANAKSDLNQTGLMNSIISPSVCLASSTSQVSPTTHTITTMVQNTLQSATTVTSSVNKPLISIKTVDSVLNPSTTKVSPVISTLPSSSLSLTATTKTNSNSHTILPALKSNPSFGPYCLKIVPKSGISNECVYSLQPIDSNCPVPQNKNFITKPSSNPSNPVPVNNEKDEQSEIQELSVSSYSLATSGENSLITSDECIKNNVKSISLLTPVHAKSIFYPKDSLLRNNCSSENLHSNLESKTSSLDNCATTNNELSSASDVDPFPSISKNSITSVSAANGSKVSQGVEKPEEPVIVLTKPLIPDPSSVKPEIVSSTSSNVTSNSLSYEFEFTIKSEPEEINKKDESVQFLKLGSFINEPNIKKEIEDNSYETNNSSTEQKPDDSVKLDNKSIQKPIENSPNGEAMFKSIKTEPISDSSNSLKAPEFSCNSKEPNQTASVINLNTTGNNSSLTSVPTTFVNGRQISLPTQSLLSSSKFVNLSDLASTSGTKFVTLANKPITSSQVSTLKSPTSSQVVTLSNQVQTGVQLPELASQISTSAPLAPSTNIHPKTTISSITTTSTTKLTQASSKTPLVALAPKISNPQIISLATQTALGLQYFKLPSKTPNCTHYIPLANNLSTGTPTQLLPLTSTPSSATHYLPLTTITPSATQLVTLPSQTPSATQLHLLTSQTPPGTQLVSLKSQTPSGPQLLALPSQTPTITQLVSLPSQTPGVTKLVSLTNQSLNCTQPVSLPNRTDTQLLPPCNQSITGTHILKLTPKIPGGAQFIQLANQVPTCTQSTLTSSPTTHIKICSATTQAQSATQIVALTSKPSAETKFIKLTKTVTSSEPQLVKLTNANSATPQYVKIYNKGSSKTLIPLTNSISSNSSVASLTTQVPTCKPQFVNVSSQTPPVVTLNQVKTGTQIMTLNNPKSADPNMVPLINQESTNKQFVALTNQNLSSGSQLVNIPDATVPGSQLVGIPTLLNPKVKLISQSVSSPPLMKLTPSNDASSTIKLVPIAKPPVLQLSNPIKTKPEDNAASKVSSSKELILNIKGNSSSSGNSLSNKVLSKLQNNEPSVVVVYPKTASDTPVTTTTIVSSRNKAVPMQSLLPPKITLQRHSPKNFEQASTSPPKSSPLKTETKTNTDCTEDFPMQLKIDSIFSLQGSDKSSDYWNASPLAPAETLSSKSVSIQAEIKPVQKSDKVSSKFTQAVMPEPEVELEKKIISKTNTTRENIFDSLASVKPIVYARLNKPKAAPKPIPILPKTSLSQSRFKQNFKMISIRQKAHKAKSYPIHGRIHVDKIKKKKYQFLQPRVLLSQLFLPARMKSVNVLKLPLDTIKSLRCNSDCIHKLRVPYMSYSLFNDKTSPTRHILVMRVDGENKVKPFSPNIANKPYYLLKDDSNQPLSLSSAESLALLRKQGRQPNSTNNSPLKVGLDKSSRNRNEFASNKDDALNCLQLACGIIQDNTLKRKSSLADDGKDEQEDSDWSLDLEMPFRLKKKKKDDEF